MTPNLLKVTECPLTSRTTNKCAYFAKTSLYSVSCHTSSTCQTWAKTTLSLSTRTEARFHILSSASPYRCTSQLGSETKTSSKCWMRSNCMRFLKRIGSNYHLKITIQEILFHTNGWSTFIFSKRGCHLTGMFWWRSSTLPPAWIIGLTSNSIWSKWRSCLGRGQGLR